MNWQEKAEKRKLSHDAGQLLVWMLDRISIPRDQWVHTYATESVKKNIPKIARKRKEFLRESIDALLGFVEVNSPCSVVTMGRLAKECLLYPPVSKKKEGAEWSVNFAFQRLDISHAWVTYMPDAALFDPSLAVEISWVLSMAAKEAGLQPKIDYTLKSFKNWYKWRK